MEYFANLKDLLVIFTILEHIQDLLKIANVCQIYESNLVWSRFQILKFSSVLFFKGFQFNSILYCRRSYFDCYYSYFIVPTFHPSTVRLMIPWFPLYNWLILLIWWQYQYLPMCIFRYLFQPFLLCLVFVFFIFLVYIM